jgi:hypothetical protein
LMNVIPFAAVTMADGVITIDADLLAPKLGLSVEVLKAEMRRGYVYKRDRTGDRFGRGVDAPHFPLSRPVLVRGGLPRRYPRRGPGDRPRAAVRRAPLREEGSQCDFLTRYSLSSPCCGAERRSRPGLLRALCGH